MKDDKEDIFYSINDMNGGIQLNISETEYHIIRQILLLMNRKLNDIGHIIRTLRSYQIEEIFGYLTKFNSPSNVRISEGSFNKEDPLYSVNHSLSKSVHSSNQYYRPDSRGNIIPMKNESLKGYLQDSSGNASNNMMLNKFVKQRNNVESQRTSEIKHDPFCIDIETICNFLEYHEVQFLPEDVPFVFKDMGLTDTKVGIDHFEKFMDSCLWG